MKKIAFFGGTGGLGREVIKYLSEYTIDPISSKMVNLLYNSDISNYFENNNDTGVVVIFSNYNYNSFLHKYKNDDLELKRQIDINITGVTECLSSSLKNMRKNGYGRIIIASSVTVSQSIMGTSIYAASKAYYENLVKTIAIENASLGITANCIQLGYMDGGLTNTLSKEFIDGIVNKIPIKRLGNPEEISKTIDFLIKTEYINGQVIKLTGGL